MPTQLRNSLVDQLTTKTLDFHGRRITNAGDATATQDYVTLAQVMAIGGVTYGFWGARPAATPGKLYYAADRSSLYIGTPNGWLFVAGGMRGVISQLPIGLGLQDTGFTFESTEYEHTLKWNGAAYKFVSGDKSRYFAMSLDGPPSGGVWGLCDGTTYNVLLTDGTVESIVTPNLADGTFLRATTAYTGTPAAAVRASWEAAAKTAIENQKHTHSYSQGGSNAFGGGAFNAVSSFTANTGDDSVDHYHALTDADAQLQLFSDVGGGMPLRFDVQVYLRR